MVSEKLVRATTLGAAAIFALAMSVTQSMAQDKGKAAPAAKPAAAAQPAAAGDKKPDIWYKLCFDVPIPEQTKEGEKPKKPEELKKTNVCITQVDIRDNATAFLIGKLAVRQGQNQPKPSLLAMLPLGSLLPAGAFVKIDDQEPIRLAYNTCDQAGCYADAEVEPAIIDKMKTGKQVAYLGIDVTGRQLAIPLPLEGFAKTIEGTPIPIEKYTEDQKKIAEVIRGKLQELRKQQEDAAKNGQGAAPAAPAAPAGKK